MQVISLNRISSRQKLFEMWFSCYAKAMLGYAREFVDSQQQAEDIVHDVFIKLWEKMDGISEEAVKTYLFRATRNKCLDYISHLRIRTKYQEEILRRGNAPDAFLDTDLYLPSQLQTLLNRAVDKLTPQQRKVFIMSKIEEIPMSEIAVELDISKRTAEKHLELAVRFLREELSDFLYFYLLVILFNR